MNIVLHAEPSPLKRRRRFIIWKYRPFSPLQKADNPRHRVLLIDAQGLVIAASDGWGLLSERFRLNTRGKPSGHYFDVDGRMIAFHKTPGYETYDGLGWYGVIARAA